MYTPVSFLRSRFRRIEAIAEVEQNGDMTDMFMRENE